MNQNKVPTYTSQPFQSAQKHSAGFLWTTLPTLSQALASCYFSCHALHLTPPLLFCSNWETNTHKNNQWNLYSACCKQRRDIVERNLFAISLGFRKMSFLSSLHPSPLNDPTRLVKKNCTENFAGKKVHPAAPRWKSCKWVTFCKPRLSAPGRQRSIFHTAVKLET